MRLFTCVSTRRYLFFDLGKNNKNLIELSSTMWWLQQYPIIIIIAERERERELKRPFFPVLRVYPLMCPPRWSMHTNCRVGKYKLIPLKQNQRPKVVTIIISHRCCTHMSSGCLVLCVEEGHDDDVRRSTTARSDHCFVITPSGGYLISRNQTLTG